MKKSAIYFVLVCTVVLSACSTRFELKDITDKLRNAAGKHSQENEKNQPKSEKMPSTGQGDSQSSQPGKGAATNDDHPESGDQKQFPEQPGQKLVESPVPPPEPVEQNALTPEVIEPDTGETMPIKTGNDPSLPAPELKINPNFLAPKKFKHPLQDVGQPEFHAWPRR